MGILEAYLSIENVKYHNFTEQEVSLIQTFIKLRQTKFVSPEFVQFCADIIECTVGLIIEGGTLVLIKMDEEEGGIDDEQICRDQQ